MRRDFFGTDGIRGEANTWPMTAETALRVGMAAGSLFMRGGHRHRDSASTEAERSSKSANRHPNRSGDTDSDGVEAAEAGRDP